MSKNNNPLCKTCQGIIDRLSDWQVKFKKDIEDKCERRRDMTCGKTINLAQEFTDELCKCRRCPLSMDTYGDKSKVCNICHNEGITDPSQIVPNPNDSRYQPEQPNNNGSKCGQCQGEFTKQGKEIIYWAEEGKENGPYFCCACKDKKEQGQGSGHRNSMKPMTSSDPNIRTMEICPFCWKDLNAQQSHDYQDGKWIVKHNCEGKCRGYYGCVGLHEKCEKSNTFKWTQENIDLLYDKRIQQGMCPDCRIKSLNWDAGLGDEEAKKTLEAVKKLIGKDNSSPPPPQVLTTQYQKIHAGEQNPVYQIRGW